MGTNQKIKICHLISGDLWAGAEAQALTLISWLSRCPEFQLTSIVFNEGRLSQELSQLGILTSVLDEKKDNSVQLFLKVRRFLSKEKVQILHTHRYKENVIGCLAAQYPMGPYLVKTVHGLKEPFKGIKRLKAGFYSFLDRWASRLFFSKIICVSYGMEEELKKELGRSKVVCIHNCVDVSRVKVKKSKSLTKKELGIENNSPVIGTAGRLVPIKGTVWLLQAAQVLLLKLPDLRVLIIGDGPERYRLRQLTSEMGIESQVIFTGQRDDVYDLISCMDVFLLPSLSEGIPMVLLETMALEIPIVATNVGGIPELLRNGQTGYLTPPRDARALAEACQYLLEHKEEAEIVARKARQLVEGNLSVRVMVEKVAQIYRSLVL